MKGVHVDMRDLNALHPVFLLVDMAQLLVGASIGAHDNEKGDHAAGLRAI